MIHIKYGNIYPFSGISPTPLVGRNYEVVRGNKRRGLREVLVLEGQITGSLSGPPITCNALWGDLKTGQADLIANFATGFQPIQIEDHESGIAVIYSAPFARVLSLNFGESKYVGHVPYTIELEIYESGYFTDNYGVLEPENSFSFREIDDNLVEIVHRVSARGFNTSASNSDALANATAFIQANSGWSNQVIPQVIGDPTSNNNILLQQVREQVDRLSNKYSIEETYIYDPSDRLSTGVLNYTMDLDSNDGGNDITIRGSIKGLKSYTMAEVRSSFNAYNFYTPSNNFYGDMRVGTLSNLPVSMSIDEDTANRTLNFNIVYSDRDVSSSPYMVDRTTITTNHETEVSCIRFRGTIQDRRPCSGSWANVLSYYNSINFKDQITSKWNAYALASGVLGDNPKSQRFTEDKQNNRLIVEYEYCTDETPVDQECLKNLSYSVSVTPPLNKFVDTPLMMGDRRVQDIQSETWVTLSINGRATMVDKSGCSPAEAFGNIVALMNSKRNEVFGEGAAAVLTNSSITTGVDNALSFSASWRSETFGSGFEGNVPDVVKFRNAQDFNGWSKNTSGNLYPNNETITLGVWRYDSEGNIYINDALDHAVDEDWEYFSSDLRPE